MLCLLQSAQGPGVGEPTSLAATTFLLEDNARAHLWSPAEMRQWIALNPRVLRLAELGAGSTAGVAAAPTRCHRHLR